MNDDRGIRLTRLWDALSTRPPRSTHYVLPPPAVACSDALGSGRDACVLALSKRHLVVHDHVPGWVLAQHRSDEAGRRTRKRLRPEDRNGQADMRGNGKVRPSLLGSALGADTTLPDQIRVLVIVAALFALVVFAWDCPGRTIVPAGSHLAILTLRTFRFSNLPDRLGPCNRRGLAPMV